MPNTPLTASLLTTDFFINTRSAYYSPLAELLESEGDIEIYWKDRETEEIGIRNTHGCRGYFTWDELSNVSSQLYQTLLALMKTNNTSTWTLGMIAKTVWSHSINPGIFIKRSNSVGRYSEWFCRNLQKIEHIDIKNKTVTAVFTGYTQDFNLSIRKVEDIVDAEETSILGGVTPVIVNAKNNHFPYTHTFDLTSLEIAYPGCSERLRIAQHLLLSPEELATITMDTSYAAAPSESLPGMG